MATKSVNERRFTIRTTDSFVFGEKQCRAQAGDTLLCDRDKLPTRGDMVVTVRHDGSGAIWRCDVPAFGRAGEPYFFGFEKDGGDVVFFESKSFQVCGVVIDSRPAAA